MTPAQLHILQHSLGVDQYGHGNQYRNHYAAEPESDAWPDLIALCRLGLMKQQGPIVAWGGMHSFCVTEAGKDAMRKESPAPPKLSRSVRRYRKWLHADCGMKFGDWLKQNMENYENECR